MLPEADLMRGALHAGSGGGHEVAGPSWDAGGEAASADDLFLQMAIQRKVHQELENHRILQEELQMHTSYIQHLQSKLKQSERNLAAAEVLHGKSLRGPGGMGMEPVAAKGGGVRGRGGHVSAEAPRAEGKYKKRVSGGKDARGGGEAATPSPPQSKKKARKDAQPEEPLSRTSSSGARDVDILVDSDILVDIPQADYTADLGHADMSFPEFHPAHDYEHAFDRDWDV